MSPETATQPVVLRRATYNRSGSLRTGLLAGTWAYFGLLILLPIVWLLKEALAQGPASLLENLARPALLHAFLMTAGLTLSAVVINTIFGVMVAYVLVRHRFPGKALVNSLIDLPFALSPVIAGYMLIVLYGPDSWLGGLAARAGFEIVFAFPAMLVATLFVTLPFVIREVGPVLAELGREQEEAAYTLGAGRWQTFLCVTLPSLRWGLLYGVTLTIARACGEFGAVLVVSGNLIGKTQTATLYVHQACMDFDRPAAYAAALVLALVSFVVLMASEMVRRRSQQAIVGGRPVDPPGGTEAPVREYLQGENEAG